MKKIYYILYIFTTIFATSCNDEDQVVNLKNEDPNMTITDISPVNGYIGNELTIYGEDFGVSEDLLKVCIGNAPVEVLSCEDKVIVVRIPEGVTTGKISLEVLGQKYLSDFIFDVLGQPGVTSIEPSAAFVGDEISFKGHDFGTEKSRIKVFFNGVESSAEIISCANEEFKVKVPEDAKTGPIRLDVSTFTNMSLPNDFTVIERATLSKLSPEKGYRGGEVTITGTNFGIQGENSKVLFGTEVAEIVSWENEKIVVKAPEALEEDLEVAVEVTTQYETIGTTLAFTVLIPPVISNVAPEQFYIGNEITVTTTGLLDIKREEMQILFGELTAPAEITSWANNNGTVTMKVKIPQGIDPGKTILRVKVLNKEFVYTNKELTLLPTPYISEVDAPNVLNQNGTSEKLVVQKEDVITLKGGNFGTDKGAIKLYVDGAESTALTIQNFENEKITLKIGENFAGGEVQLYYEGIPLVESDEALTMIQTGDDITEFVLRNYKRNFETKTEEGITGLPAYWDMNSSAKSFTRIKDSNGNANLVLADWGNNCDNGKVWQTAILPSGSYTVSVNMAECGTSGGRFNSYFIVAEGAGGDQSLPDVDANGNLSNGTTIFDKAKLTDNRGNDVTSTLTFSLSDDKSITLGFVSMLYNKSYVKISSISIVKN